MLTSLHSDRWLVLIAYMTGLSIGVHLLNLLCIPAIVLVYYYKKVPHANLKGFAPGAVPFIPRSGSRTVWCGSRYHHRRRLVRTVLCQHLGCPFNTGEIVYIICLVASVIWGIYETCQCI